MSKTKELGEGTGIFSIYCEGCGCHHNLHTKSDNEVGAKWRFNGNLKEPTFVPSLLVTSEALNKVCHSIITVGTIQYLNDCTHDLKGKIIQLPEINFNYEKN